MPLAEYDENSGLYWLDSEHTYAFNGTEEARAQYEQKLKKTIQLKKELSELSKSGKLNAYLRKYGLVTYRCQRGCLLGTVFNHAGEKYFYSWDRGMENVIETEEGLDLEYEVIHRFYLHWFDLDGTYEAAGFYSAGECRHLNAWLSRSKVVEHIEALKKKSKKTVYLSRPSNL